MIKAVIFDADGTLLENEEFILQPLEKTLAHFNDDKLPSRNALRNQIGRSLESVYKDLIPGQMYQYEKIKKYHRHYQLNNMDLLKLYDGTMDLLEFLKTKKIKLAIFSSRDVSLVPSLKHLKIFDFFDTVVGGEDVDNHKPHPEGSLLILKRLDVEAEEAVLVGDAIFDIQAAKAAGIKSIAVTHGFGVHSHLKKESPEYIANNLQEVKKILSAKI